MNATHASVQSQTSHKGLTHLLVTSLLTVGLFLPLSEAAAATLSRSSYFEYDTVSGLLKKEIIEPGDSKLCLVTEYLYDDFGNKTSVTTRNCAGQSGEAPAPVGTDAVITPRTTSSTYTNASDNTGRFPLTTTNALLHTETRSYEPKFGNVVSLVGPNGLPTSWEYDSFGRKTKETRADTTTTTWFYNQPCDLANGDLLQAKYCIATISTGTVRYTRAYYDGLNRQLATTRIDFTNTLWIDEGRVDYDAKGRVSKSYQPYVRGSFATAKYNTYSYDDLNRVTNETAPDGSLTQKAYQGLTSKVTNALGQITTTIKNTQGQTVSVIDAQGNGINYGYDVFGNLVKTVDAQGNITTLTYDTRGRKTVMVDPDMGTWTYVYNALGELVRQDDAKGQPTYMTYDKLGRMIRRGENDLTSNWYYDTDKAGVACGLSKGKLCQAEVDNVYGYNRTHFYDPIDKGRLSRTTTTAGSDGTYTTKTTYDTAGRPLVQTYPASPSHPPGFAVKNIYNTVGYLTQVVNAVTPTTVYWTANSMDAAGHLTRQTYGNNVTTDQIYDPNTGRLTRQIAGPGNSVQDMSYTYDSLGNLLTRSNLYPSGTGNIALKESFGYDRLNRVISANTTGQNVTLPDGITTTAFITPEVFDYNAIGNIVSKTGVGSYTYNAVTPSGRILPHALAGITGTLNGSTNPAFVYDNNGNMLSGAGRTIAWTSFNIPKTITSNGKTAEFWYSPEHERIRELQSDGSIVITLSPRYDTGLHFEKRLLTTGNVLDGRVEYEHYLYAGGLMFGKYVTINNAAGVLTSSKVEYYHKDHLGSIVAITDENGVIALDEQSQPKRYAYDVWGKRRNPNGTANNSLNPDMYHGFTGHEMLDDLGLIHMNGRLYDPVTGRFISADFMIPDGGNLQSYNRYSYVFNNPLSYTDADGQCPICIGMLIGALIAGAESNWNFDAMVQGAVIGGLTAGIGQGVQAAVSLYTNGVVGAMAGAWAGGYAGTYMATGGDAEAARKAGASAALSAGLFNLAGGDWSGEHGKFGKVMAHAVAGCVGASASGGKCSQGALSAGFAEYAGPKITGGMGDAGKLFAHTMLGGVAAELGGGKFRNGAITGAFGYLYNHCFHSEGGCDIWGDVQKQVTDVWYETYKGLAQTGAEVLSVMVAPELLVAKNAAAISIETKIARQMTKRGWSEAEIMNVVSNPDRVITGLRDTRNLPSGGRLNAPATAYVRADGHYIVRNDQNGSIVQISNRNKTDWKSPF